MRAALLLCALPSAFLGIGTPVSLANASDLDWLPALVVDEITQRLQPIDLLQWSQTARRFLLPAFDPQHRQPLRESCGDEVTDSWMHVYFAAQTEGSSDASRLLELAPASLKRDAFFRPSCLRVLFAFCRLDLFRGQTSTAQPPSFRLRVWKMTAQELRALHQFYNGACSVELELTFHDQQTIQELYQTFGAEATPLEPPKLAYHLRARNSHEWEPLAVLLEQNPVLVRSVTLTDTVDPDLEAFQRILRSVGSASVPLESFVWSMVFSGMPTESLALFVDGFESHPFPVRRLVLAGAAFSLSQSRRFLLALGNKPHLRDLSLKYSNIRLAEHPQELKAVLGRPECSITSLAWGRLRTRPTDGIALAKALKSNRSLRKLIIFAPYSLKEGLEAIVRAANVQGHLEVFSMDVRQCRDLRGTIHALSQLLQGNPQLRELSFTGFHDGRTSLAPMWKVLPNSPTALKALDLTSSRLDTAAMRALGEYLASPYNTKLKSLILSSCTTSAEDATHLLQALRNNRHLEHLDLSNFMYGGRLVSSFVNVLSENQHLKSLRLSDCMLTYHGFLRLVRGISQNPHSVLRHLDVSDNFIGLQAVANVDIPDSQVEDGPVEPITNPAPPNYPIQATTPPVLRTLNLDNNRFSEEMLYRLVHDLQSFRTSLRKVLVREREQGNGEITGLDSPRTFSLRTMRRIKTMLQPAQVHFHGHDS